MRLMTTFYLSCMSGKLGSLTVLLAAAVAISACSNSNDQSGRDASDVNVYEQQFEQTSGSTAMSNAYQKPGAPVRFMADTIKVAAAGDYALLQYELQVSADADVMSVSISATPGITLDPVDSAWTAKGLKSGDSQKAGLSIFAYQPGFVNMLVTMHDANDQAQSRSFSVPVVVANQPLPSEKSGTLEITEEGERLISMPAEETP